MKKVFVDANVLMDYSSEIFKSFDRVLISGYVLQELDKYKNDSRYPDRQFKARRAGRDIEKYENSKVEYVYREGAYSLPYYFESDIIDNQILSVYKELYIKDNSIIALSNDLYFRRSCKLLGLPCEKFEQNIELYKGYKKLQGNTEFINKLFEDIGNGINEYGFLPNEYLLLYNTDLDDFIEMRFDGEKFVKLKLPSSKIIKGLNSEQRFALDLLNNPNITISVIQGCMGSGKTYLALRMGLYHIKEKGTYSKLLGIREPIGEGKHIGYLPGEFDDKTERFFKPLEQSLNGGFQELNNLIQNGFLELNIPYYIKGTTYDNTFILVDESSDLSMDQLINIGGRMGENSKIVFVGDYRQSVYNKSKNNALINLVNELKGNPFFGTVTLSEDVRSQGSKIFAELMDKYY